MLVTGKRSTQRENQKDDDIPDRVGEDHRDQALLPLIEPAPEETTDRSGHQEHHIKRENMDERINNGCQKNTCRRTAALAQNPLDETMPVNFLRRPHDEEEKEANGPDIELSLVEIDV